MRNEGFEGFVGLFAQLAAVAQKQNAFGPTSPEHDVANRNGNASFAGAGGLH